MVLLNANVNCARSIDSVPLPTRWVEQIKQAARTVNPTDAQAVIAALAAALEGVDADYADVTDCPFEGTVDIEPGVRTIDWTCPLCSAQHSDPA